MADVKKVVEIEIDVDSREISQTTKEIDGASAATTGLTSQLDKMTGGAVSGFTGMVKGVKSGITAMKSLRGAIIATGLGALVVVIGSLVAYFTETERGAQKLRVIMAGLGAVMGAIKDIAIALGEAIVEAFENPQKALDDLVIQIKYYFLEFIPNAIDNVIGGFNLLGTAIKKALAGDFDEAMQVATEGTKQLADGLTDLHPGALIIKQLAKGAMELGKEIQKDVEAAIELEERMNKLKVAERELTVQRAQTNKKIAEARLMAEDESQAAEVRLEKLKEAVALEQQQAARELAQEQERLSIMNAQADLNESDEETLQGIADQRAKVIDLQTASLRTQKRLATEVISLEREIAANNKKAEDDEQKRKDEAHKERMEQLQAEYDAAVELLQQQDALEFQLMKEGQEKAELALMQKYDALHEIAYGNRELEKQLEEAFQREMQAIQDKYANEAKQKRDKEVQDKINAFQKEADYQLGTANNALKAISSLNQAFRNEEENMSEKERKRAFQADKAFNIASATITTAQAAIKAYTSQLLPGDPTSPIRATIAAGIATATGLAQIAMIARQEYSPRGGGGGGASMPTSSSAGAGQAPQFNTVGGSEVNQLSQSIAGQNQKPVQAYVVANDVTSAQSLERNRQQQASFP
jgi:hypothetical protein